MDIELTETELEELRKKAHAYDSEHGRLNKVQTELETERAQRAELEARLAAQAQTEQEPPIYDPKEVLGEDGLAVLNNIIAPLSGKLDMIGKKFEERDLAETRASAMKKFQSELDSKLSDENLPGFASRLYGGDLTAAWSKFVETRPSVRRAQSEGDVESVTDSMANFINQNKELVAGGGYSPRSVSGSSSGVQCDYTDVDYMRDSSALKEQKNNLVITEAEFNKQSGLLWQKYVDAQKKMEAAEARYGLV